jgi:hypothetical protein
MPYAYLTLAQLRGELMARLEDAEPGTFYSDAELNIYISEALRLLNVLTYAWNSDYQLDFNPGNTWNYTNDPDSPRNQTVTDNYLYMQMEAMLLEPMTGGTWTGTTQFNIGLLSAAMQYRRDELLLQSAANMFNTFTEAPLLSTRTVLPDLTLDLLRVRWIPQDGSAPYALGREDVDTANAFGPLLNIQPGAPDSWLITASPPLAFDVSCPPNQPGQFDMLVSYSGTSFTPPAVNLVSIPDDWTPALIYGALADVLENSMEGRDSIRAKYCLQRYEHLKKAMLKLPWLLEASVASVPVDTPSFKEMDSWAQNWENTWPANDPQIVVAGVDLVALAPFVPASGTTVSTVVTLVGNAPLPASDAAFIQLARDGVDAVLSYCQHLSSFKMGGEDFIATMPLLEQFEAYCRRKNAQYAALGIFRPQLLMEGDRADEIDPRFLPEEARRG